MLQDLTSPIATFLRRDEAMPLSGYWIGLVLLLTGGLALFALLDNGSERLVPRGGARVVYDDEDIHPAQALAGPHFGRARLAARERHRQAINRTGKEGIRAR